MHIVLVYIDGPPYMQGQGPAHRWTLVWPLCPVAALRERGFVLFSAHRWVALEGTVEYEFVRPAHRQPQPC